MFFLSINTNVFSQNTDSANCGNITTSQSLELFNNLRPQLKNYEEHFLQNKRNTNKTSRTPINSVPVNITILRNTDGSEGINVSDVKNAISNLNSIYAEAYLEFFICGEVNYIDDDESVHVKKGSERYLTETNNVPGSINIYFTHEIVNASNESICGYSNNISRNDFIMIKNDCATNNSSLAHEIGHFFSLIHTHGPDDTNSTELVDGSNCDTDGDGICDTPADPKLSYTNVNSNCNYTGAETDANGTKYNPDTNNIMSYSRKECRNFFSDQQLARIYAYYQTVKNYLSCPDFNADFTADVSQTCEDSLTVTFENSCENVTSLEWDMNSDGITDYTTKNPTHTFNSGIYDITLTVHTKTKTITKTYANFIKVGTELNVLNEDFEDLVLFGDHGWTAKDASGNGYSWLLNKGETYTEETGPTFKNSGNKVTNTYIYAEASGAKYGDVAEFVSPCINVDYSNSEIEFSYHMFGSGIGELHVDVKTDNGYILDVIEPLIGSQQTNQEDDFLIQNIDLSTFTNQTINIRFRAIRGTSWEGDIAIDNILFKTISTSITDTPVKVYPNPMRGNLLYVKTDTPKEPTTFQISSLEGQVFKSGTLTTRPIDVSNLSSGMYLITIEKKGSRITKKIIK
ncbi:T9SS-dependent choice-of-anchor J family protein [Algibacter aquimarinus]|uniref:MAM domain-containing protein n=1 Tax=Algibacter aquimarinus TaxID=1136748 RepID=A0ABP9HST8_9FLAO